MTRTPREPRSACAPLCSALALVGLVLSCIPQPGAAAELRPGVWEWACYGAGYDGAHPAGEYTSQCYKQATQQPTPQMRGWFLLLNWADVEPADGHFDWSALDTNLTKAADLGLQVQPIIFICDTAANSTPGWVYDVSGVVMFHRGSIHGKAIPAPNYLNATFQQRFGRLINNLAAHLDSLPASIRGSIWAVQAALGITGDSRPWDGVPVDPRQTISGPQWVAYCRSMLAVWAKAFAPTGISVVANVDNPAYNQSDVGWWLATATALGVHSPAFKQGIVSHGYQLNGEQMLYDDEARKYLLAPQADGHFAWARGELALEPDPIPGTYGNWAVSPYWSLQANAEWALTYGLTVWNLYAGFLGNATFAPTMDFYNRHAGQMNVSSASAAFLSFRDSLNTEDTQRWPVATFGPVNSTKHATQLNPDRMVAIAKANSARGARVDDPTQAASRKSVVQKKGMFLNDVCWACWTGNYGRYLQQLDPQGSSVGWWRVGAKNEPYGRFARGLEHASNRTQISVRVDPLFGASRRQSTARARAAATVSVVYLDKGRGRWTLALDGDVVATVHKIDSGSWKTATAQVLLAGGSSSAAGHVLSLQSLDSQDDVFSLLEVLLDGDKP